MALYSLNKEMKKVKINNVLYKIPNTNYIEKEKSKHQIVIGGTLTQNMVHVKGWTTRVGGNFKRTAPFTIDINGNIFQHYDPKYYSEFLGIESLDEQIIPILIENEGWLEKDVYTDEYINWLGNTYNRRDEVAKTKWRGKNYWAPYSEQQLESALDLVRYLSKRFNIPRKVVYHNTWFDEAPEYNGIVYKSNFERHFTDLNPTWKYVEFKNKLELK